MNSRPKPAIFIFTTAYEPFIGGAEIAVAETVNQLRNEFHFFIFTSRFRSGRPKQEEQDGVIIRRIGFGFSFDKFLLPVLGFFVVRRYMARVKPALFWAVMVSFASGIPYMVNMFRFGEPIPVVLTLQEGDSAVHIKIARLGLIALAWHQALARTSFLTAISTFLLDLGKEFGYRGEARVIPNGVDISEFSKEFMPEELQHLRDELGIAGNEKVIITTSRFVEKNAVDIIIRAVSILIKKGKKIKLLLAGSGRDEPALRALAKSEGAGEQIIFLGDINHRQVPKYLKISDVFVRPSRSEGLGNSFIEAMAAGLPIIGTMTGGIADFLVDGRTGLAVPVDDYENLALKIEKLLADPGLRARISTAAKEAVRTRFQWPTIAGDFGALFKQFAEASGKLRIVIATPLFPPSIGGPAAYAYNLRDALVKKGHSVTVLSYSNTQKAGADYKGRVAFVSARLPSGLKHFVFFVRAFLELARHDAAIVLDPFIVGLPVVLASRLLAKKMFLRVEGDFIWETYLERTGAELTLKEFYNQPAGPALNLKEKIVRHFSALAYKNSAALVFSSPWREAIFRSAYPVSRRPSVFIEPPWPEAGEYRIQRAKKILWAGRFIKAKNLPHLIKAFLRAAPVGFGLELVGDGPEKENIKNLIRGLGAEAKISITPPLEREELLEKMAASFGFALPSLSDVAPNVILDCIKTGTPFLLTEESGLARTLEGLAVLVNPKSKASIASGLRALFDPDQHELFIKRIAAFQKRHPWEAIAGEWLELFS